MRKKMHKTRLVACAICTTMLMAAGCKTNTVDKMAFKSAINDYYKAKPVCIWTTTVKFPAQADTSNDDQTKGFDALVDAGLLTRQSAEKKRFLIGSKQVNNYDLSDKGRSTWTADPSQPGYGNFCVGPREVTNIDGYTPADNPNATQYSVAYHYDISSAPDWANSAETKTAFPALAGDLSGQQSASASLVKSSNGWQVSSVQQPTASELPK